eukprot:94757-Hanusia_phi.AAC.4
MGAARVGSDLEKTAFHLGAHSESAHVTLQGGGSRIHGAQRSRRLGLLVGPENVPVGTSSSASRFQNHIATCFEPSLPPYPGIAGAFRVKFYARAGVKSRNP